MRLALKLRWVGFVLLLVGSVSVAVCVTPAAGAYTLRSPQVPLQTGWDGISLQTYLAGIGETLNTLTQQLDLQAWQAPPAGVSTFTLVMELAGYAGQNTIGIYNAGEVSPSEFVVFPGAAGPGWSATCTFSAGGVLDVSLYDDQHVLQGTTHYTGADRNNFGFYLQGPGGIFFSQDYRNAGEKPQVLTYQGTGQYAGSWWECFEDLPYASSDLDFQDSIMLVQSTEPVPVHGLTWGALKSLFR
jgi:hypothetical protein